MSRWNPSVGQWSHVAASGSDTRYPLNTDRMVREDEAIVRANREGRTREHPRPQITAMTPPARCISC
ncbi:MAG: hypothetical protein AAB417_01955 [Patescibacteria group bacterium]